MKRIFVSCAVVLVVGLMVFGTLAQAQAPAKAPAQARGGAQDKGAAMKMSTVPQTPEWK